jgi:hypothetical protein
MFVHVFQARREHFDGRQAGFVADLSDWFHTRKVFRYALTLEVHQAADAGAYRMTARFEYPWRPAVVLLQPAPAPPPTAQLYASDRRGQYELF